MPLGRVFLLLLAVFAALAAPSAAATRADWDPGAQRTVMRAGVMAEVPGAGFAGDHALTAGALNQALATFAARSASPTAAHPSGRVTVISFDRTLVAQLGLTDLADAVQAETRRAGLHPPRYYGTEVVARQLGLRFTQPHGQEAIELYPGDTMTRAEAAWSFAQVLRFDGSQQNYAREVFARYVLPTYSGAQKRALRVAVSKIGMPYVWGGETDGPGGADGPQPHGGYDCSGYVWRVFKLSGNPAGRAIDGRTAADQAGEIPVASRIAFEAIRPADLVFFGKATLHSSPRGIDHVGIAMSGDFMINASGQGVFVSPLFEQWRRDGFAWARRVV